MMTCTPLSVTRLDEYSILCSDYVYSMHIFNTANISYPTQIDVSFAVLNVLNYVRSEWFELWTLRI